MDFNLMSTMQRLDHIQLSVEAAAQSHSETVLRLAEQLTCRPGRILNSMLKVQEILDALMTRVIEVLGAERGFALLRPEVDEEWQFRSACALPEQTVAQEEFLISRGVVDRVAREGVSVTTSDAQQDERYGHQACMSLDNLRSICCVPIKISGRVLGVLYIDHRLATGAFDRHTQILLEALSCEAAVALGDALLAERLKDAQARPRHPSRNTGGNPGSVASSTFYNGGQRGSRKKQFPGSPFRGSRTRIQVGAPVLARIGLCQRALTRLSAILKALLPLVIS